MLNKIKDKIQGKKVIISGGLGFIGHNLTLKLVNDYNCEVTVIDNCLNSSPEILSAIDGKYKLIKDTILNSNLYSLFNDVDYIFHLACIQIAHSSKDPLMDMQVNAQSTLGILEYLRHNKDKIALKRFVYTSSASVYGSAKNYPSNEDGSTKVLSHYAATKLLGENYTLIYNKQYDLSTSSVRYSNIYGKGQTPNNPYCGVIGKFIHNALIGNALGVIGDGQQTRDYTYIDDAIDATILAAIHPNAEGQVFNIGTGVDTTINELAETVKNLIPNSKVEHIPPRDIDNIRRRVMDISHIQEKLGWEPLVDFTEGIKRTVEWYKSYISKV